MAGTSEPSVALPRGPSRVPGAPGTAALLAGLCAALVLLLSGQQLALGAGLSLVAAIAARVLIAARGRRAAPGPPPPGPRDLTLLGRALNLNLNNIRLSLPALAKKYGSVFQVQGLGRTIVVLHGYDTVKEALVGHAELFEERPFFPVFDMFMDGHGILFARGDRWRQMRRFALRTLRDFGMGRSTIEEKVLEEASFLCDDFRATNGAAWDPRGKVTCAVSNIICSIAFGKRFSHDDAEFARLLSLLNENVKLIGSPLTQIHNIFPFLRRLPGPHNKLYENVEQLTAFLSAIIDGHRSADERGQKPQDFIAAFLARQDEEAANPETHFTDKNLLIVVLNLFFAGTETTSTTIRWALLLLMKNPDVQTRLREELLAVVGSERPPALSDRDKLPFTNAVLHEVQRFASIVPLGLPHATTGDAIFHGYFLPKGTFVFPALDSVLKDPSQWEWPEEFRVEHFLDEHGGFRRRDAFLPFSAGRRVCLGEQLAKAELFLLLVALLQKFSFVAPRGPDSLSLAPLDGLALAPRPFEVCAVPL